VRLKRPHYTPGAGFSPQFAATEDRLGSAAASRRENCPTLPPRTGTPWRARTKSSGGDFRGCRRRRGISHWLEITQGEIPRFARNDTHTDSSGGLAGPAGRCHSCSQLAVADLAPLWTRNPYFVLRDTMHFRSF